MSAAGIAHRLSIIEDEAQALVSVLGFDASYYDKFLAGLVQRLASEVAALAAVVVPVVVEDPDAAADRAAERAERDAWLENYREGWSR